MKTIRQVGLVLGFVLLSSGPAFGQAKLGPHVVDSNGLRIGYWTGWDSILDWQETMVFIGGTAFRVATGREGFIGPDSSDFVYFAAPDCTGAAHLKLNTFRDLVPRGWYTTDAVFHYPSPAVEVNVPFSSSRHFNADGSVDPCLNGAGTLGSGAEYLTASAPVFTPPFLVVEAFPISPPPALATFNDVPTNHPFFRYIEALKASGITGGCQGSPPLYCPDNPVTRGQVAVFLAKALGL